MSYALLIEDDPDIIRTAASLIRDEGFLLETASSWDEGLDKFYAYSPDVVISDYNLRGSKMGLTLLLEVSRLRPPCA
jgi:CheY-like chemotaxis protein